MSTIALIRMKGLFSMPPKMRGSLASFKLDRLGELPDCLPAEKFRSWVNCAPEKLFAAIELAVKSK